MGGCKSDSVSPTVCRSPDNVLAQIQVGISGWDATPCREAPYPEINEGTGLRRRHRPVSDDAGPQSYCGTALTMAITITIAATIAPSTPPTDSDVISVLSPTD